MFSVPDVLQAVCEAVLNGNVSVSALGSLPAPVFDLQCPVIPWYPQEVGSAPHAWMSISMDTRIPFQSKNQQEDPLPCLHTAKWHHWQSSALWVVQPPSLVLAHPRVPCAAQKWCAGGTLQPCKWCSFAAWKSERLGFFTCLNAFKRGPPHARIVTPAAKARSTESHNSLVKVASAARHTGSLSSSYLVRSWLAVLCPKEHPSPLCEERLSLVLP